MEEKKYKMEYRYFTLREGCGERRHIGTVAVLIKIELPTYQFINTEQTNKEFNEKIEFALLDHFDEKCKLVKPLDFQNYLSTDPHEESFIFTDDDDDEPSEDQFEIEQTWLY